MDIPLWTILALPVSSRLLLLVEESSSLNKEGSRGRPARQMQRDRQPCQGTGREIRQTGCQVGHEALSRLDLLQTGEEASGQPVRMQEGWQMTVCWQERVDRAGRQLRAGLRLGERGKPEAAIGREVKLSHKVTRFHPGRG